MAEKKSKNISKSSSNTKKKRITIGVFGKKFLLGMTLCTLSAAVGAGIAYGVVVATNVSNSTNQANTNSVSLYADGGSPVSMTIGSSTNAQSFNVHEDNLPTLNNYVNKNASYLTLSLVFKSLEFTFTNETVIQKNDISFSLVLISDVANAAPTTLSFNLSNNNDITVPSGGTLTFTNLVFDFKVDVAEDGSISLTKSITENSTLKVGNLSVK